MYSLWFQNSSKIPSKSSQVIQSGADKFSMGANKNKKVAIKVEGPIRIETVNKLEALGYLVILVSK